MSDTYKFLGELLRLPFFLFALYFWSVIVISFIMPFALVCIVGQPLIFPFLYICAFITGAFLGEERPPRFEGYWNDYPLRYIRWLKTGYPRIWAWFLTGR